MNTTTLTDKHQSLTEDQFNLIETIKSEYEVGMLAINSLNKHTVTVYGGSLIKSTDKDYKDIETVSKSFAQNGWAVISGGGPGVMTAALSGAKEGGGKAIAFCINISGEPPFTHPDLSITFSQFSVRKYLLRQSDVFIFAPGGVGTLDELMEILTLIKTHKHPVKSIFLYNSRFWAGYINWLEDILIEKKKVITGNFMGLFHLVDSPEEIMNILGYEKNLK
jgi:uncharacterized protein (TIGR00730 family)